MFLLFILPFSHTLKSQPNPDIDKLERYFEALEENNRFMGSVYIMHNHEVIFNNAYGQAADDGAAASPSSIYRIGSITKSYTAVMILQLTEQGKLSLDSTLGEFFPSIPNSDSITIKHLLRHQSGLVNFTNLPEYLDYHTHPRSREEHLALFEQIGSSFAPGSNTEYSNTAYLLLGFIIEDLTGMSFGEALQQMITEPLGLYATYYGKTIDTSSGEVQSFTYNDGKWHLSFETDMSVPHAAGAIVSTAEETALFYNALFNSEILDEETYSQMTSFTGPFGLGLIRFPFHEISMYGHNGGIDGFQSNSAHDPENNLTFAVLGNGVNYNLNNILIGLLSITYGKEFDIPDFEERQAITLTDEQLIAYSGSYSSADIPLQINLFVDNGNLMGQATGQPAFPLTIYDEQTMAFEQAGLEIIFDEKTEGRYSEFDLIQGGATYRFTLDEN